MVQNPVDTYIASYPAEVQNKLKEIRKIALEEVEGAEEIISYGVPTVKLHGKYVVYFAGFKDHISIYPVTDSLEKEIPEVLSYKKGKGTLWFPLTKELPLPLIRKIVKHMLKEHQQRTGQK